MKIEPRRRRVQALLEQDIDWTPRQRQVLDLLAHGKSNQEIADSLRISLDGAKWHMREILSKLGVESREEAAEYWRRYHGWGPRVRRVFGGGGMAAWTKWAAGAVTMSLVAGVVAAVVMAARQGDDESRGSTGQETPTPADTPTPTPSAITGLFETPRDIRADATVTLPAPTPQFREPSGATIYDLRGKTQIDLGPGSTPVFSPDSRKAAWVSGDNALEGGEAMLLDLSGGTRRSLGTARLVRFEGNDKLLLIDPGANTGWRVDLLTGNREPATLPRLPDPSPTGRYDIRATANLGPELERGGTAKRAFQLSEVASGRVLYEFAAFAATLAGDDALVVATSPVGRLTNIFLIDIGSGQATYVATAEISSPNWPFTASSRYVVWTNAYCSETPGRMHIYDRQTGQVTEIDDGAADLEEAYGRRWAKFTSQGLLQIGPFSGGTLLDLESMTYPTVIPGGHVNWSADYRYGAQGQFGGHGGLC